MGRKKVQIDTFFHFYGHFLVKSGLSTLRVLSQFWPKRVPPPKGTTGIRAGFLVPCPPDLHITVIPVGKLLFHSLRYVTKNG